MYKYVKRNFIDFKQMFYDIICIVISYFIASLISYKEIYYQNILPNAWIPILFGILYLCFMYMFDMYNLTTFTYQDRALRDIMLSTIFSYIICLFMLMFVQPENANKLFFTVYLLVALLTLICQFILVHEIRKSRSNHRQSRVLLVGASENIQEYIYYLKKTSIKFNIIGYISTDNLYEIPELKNLGELKSIDEFLNKYKVDEVIFAVHYSKIKDIEQYIVTCENRGIIARIALDFSELNRVNSYMHSVGTIPVLSFQTKVRKNFRKFIKRFIDIIVSFIGSVVLFISSFLFVPLILITSGRPVLQKEEIITLNGYFFKRIKFKINEQKTIGKFLKISRLAGLPQTLNILKGDMSIVGTKPLTPSDVDKLDKNDFRRLTIRPGVIGPWTVDCINNSDEDEDCTIAVDERYIDTWSLKKDLVIIFKALLHRH